jgi:hypothetical protein
MTMGVTITDVGEHELKGLARRRRLYRLTGDNPASDVDAA